MSDWLPITPGLISVVIPMKNARDYIAAACASILAESEPPLELIVVDDGSTDGSADAVRQLGDGRARVIPGPGEGNIAASVNAGLRQARGEWFVRCDADDLSVPGRLAWQKAWLDAHPDHIALAAAFDTIDPAGRPLSPMNRDDVAGDITDELHDGQTRTHLNTFMIRMEAIRQVRGLRSYFTCAEDIDLQCRLARVGRVWFEPRIVYRYRLHEASITHRLPDARRQFLTETARAFARQRRERGEDDLERGCPPTPPKGDASTHQASRHMQDVLIGRAWREYARGQRGEAVRTASRAVWMHPTRWQAWRQWAVLLGKCLCGGARQARNGG